MSKPTIDQKDIKTLFSDKKSDFLIPDYQRPYAWGEKECLTLWDDIFAFAFPNNDSDAFDVNDEYFLGPIVTFRNDEDKQEIIDGQQRLTTLMLLLRAFYAKYGSMQSEKAKKTAHSIEQCLWKTDEFGDPDKSQLKINSEVATDSDRDEFLEILKAGSADGMKSRYAVNYRLFQTKISEFQNSYPDFFSYFPIRILNNCVLLTIEAESQDTALRIFSTLNDRGLPLSDADIFKAQFYKFYSSLGEKDNFIKRWKDLEVLCNDIFHPITGTPMDELFTRYMYYLRAKQGLKRSTTEALRKFYEHDSYALLKSKETMENLVDLANFWNDVLNQDSDRFTEKELRRLFVLQYAPNGMWSYFLSVYYLSYRDTDGNLEEAPLIEFLNRMIGFIWAYAVVNPGVNALRTPVYAEMVNVVNHMPVTFSGFKLDRGRVETALKNYRFTNNRAITKSMVTWWAFTDDEQPLLSLENAFEIEHIYAKNRYEKEGSLTDPANLESLGNKALLEKRINIRASDYRFVDKKKYYEGYTNAKGQFKEGTKNKELREIADSKKDFTEADIIERHDAMINGFMKYLEQYDLLK
jgi:hypothetical protein